LVRIDIVGADRLDEPVNGPAEPAFGHAWWSSHNDLACNGFYGDSLLNFTSILYQLIQVRIISAGIKAN
jgi:hypothetical protein